MEQILEKIKSALNSLDKNRDISELSEIPVVDNNDSTDANKSATIYRVTFKKKNITYILSVHLKGILIHIEIKLIFQYEMNNKVKQEKIFDVVNKFNGQVPGFKAVLEKNKGRNLIVSFRAQALMPSSLNIPFQDYIDLNTNALITSPILFSAYLNNDNYKHKRITE
ncbi:hypothetical protein ACNART_07910 [Proteus sp. LHD240705]|uniref:hypothetical protein n=1 Tax=Proteus sp. LHD240705 TaxID=3400183 RepID=UPI003A4DEFBC